ncbi:hypothetical protein [Streptomyces sp. NPDC059080]|uniref:hypothetical protein n=1 Tax=Streptomyces sp. NPDC059080 TaxID=3346718 RepID=UPI0036A7821E
MSNAPVDPAEVPVFTGDLDLLESKVKSLSHSGPKIATAGSDVHKSFGGLSAFYKAPEAEQLFAVTKPVADKAHDVSTDVRVIAKALGTYAREITPLVKQLDQLKRDAADFRHKVAGDDDWCEDGDLTDENLSRRNKIAEVWTAFQAAERDCHAKIVGLVGGKKLHAIDGSHTTGYGYDAEALKQSKRLPWGDAVEESVPWWKVWRHAYDFGKGVIVDGVWGTIRGLGTLFCVDGWDAAGQAWTGLAKLSTGITITTMPLLGPAFLAIPSDKLPSWLRDSRTAMKETGKALVAWDQWESNAPRAAGAVTFNVLTAVFTEGAGAAASGAGKAGAAAKVVSFAGKAGKAIDPMTYVFKAAGAGVLKISAVMAHLKDAGHFKIPQISEGAFALPEGAVTMSDGTIQLPKEAAVPEDATKLPNGRIKLPEGTVTLPPHTVKDPFTGNYTDATGNLYSKDGSLLQHAEHAPEGAPASGADSPRIDTPAHQEQRVPAGVGGRGDDAIRVGSDISDTGHVGDNVGHRDVDPGDNTPRGQAGDHGTPGGNAGNNMPTNNLNYNRPGDGSRVTDTTPTGGHTNHAPSSGSGHVPGGGSGDTPLSSHGGAHPEMPPTGGLDDATHAADGTTAPGHRANNNGDVRELTAEERKAIQDEHVRKANEDPAWYEKYYDRRGHRLRKSVKVDGVELPILKELPNGKKVAKFDLPNGPSEVRFGRTPHGPQSADPAHLMELNKSAKDRHIARDLTNAEKAYADSPSNATRQALTDAQTAYREQLGNVPNNSKIPEKLGEDAAALHVVPIEFSNAVDVPLPKTPNGANMFDQVYELGRGTGEYLIVEAKAPRGDLDWRQGGGDEERGVTAPQGMRVKQGTRLYVETILSEMWKRGPEDIRIADALYTALEEGKLQYVLVKANENTGTYAGAVMEHLRF